MSGFLVMADGRSVPAIDGLTIGRLSSCGVQIGDTKASRKHAALRIEGSVVELEDLESSNGTLLNGKPVRRRVLRDGDVVRIGTTEITYRASDAVDGTAVKPGREVLVEELDFAEDDAPAVDPIAGDPIAEVDANPSIGEDLFASSEPEVLEFADDDIVEVTPPPAPARPPRADPPVKPPARAPRPESRPESRPEEPVVARREPRAPAEGPRESRPKRAAPDEPSATGGRGGPREHGVLKFQSTPGRGGLLGDDLGQMSNGKRTLLVLIAVAVAIALGVLAMQMSG